MGKKEIVTFSSDVKDTKSRPKAKKPVLVPTESAKQINALSTLANAVDGPIDDEEVWSVIDTFFRDNALHSSQTDSYNDFINHGIHKIIEHSGKIHVSVDSHRANSTTNEKKTRTLSIEFSSLRFGQVIITETDDSTRPLFPSEALSRSTSYKSDMYCDISVSTDGGKQTFYPSQHIGSMPVMALSCLCNMTPIIDDPDEMAKHNEDVFDVGGYFILASKGEGSKGASAQRRVIIPQERAAPNKTYVFQKRKMPPKYPLYSEVRSTTGYKTTVVTIGLLSPIGSGPRITSVLQWIDGVEIPLGILFGALGVTSYELIVALILGSNYQVDIDIDDQPTALEKFYIDALNLIVHLSNTLLNARESKHLVTLSDAKDEGISRLQLQKREMTLTPI